MAVFAVASLGFAYGYAEGADGLNCLAMHYAAIGSGLALLAAALALRTRKSLWTCLLAGSFASFLIDPMIYAYGFALYLVLCQSAGIVLAELCEDATGTGPRFWGSTVSLAVGLMGASYGVLMAYRIESPPHAPLLWGTVQALFFLMALCWLLFRVHAPATWDEIRDGLKASFIPR